MAKVSWGTSAGVTFNTDAISVKMESQAKSAPWVIGDLSGGLTPLSIVHNLDPQSAIYGGNKQWYNQGVMCLPGGITSRAYKSTAQAALAAVDVSAYRAAGKRVHSVMWPTSTGGRLIVCIGPNLYKTTSVSNAALVAPATADNITDNVTAMWIGYAAGSLALFIGTDGTTDDIKYTTDPTADSISWTSAATFSSGDRCNWGFYSHSLGWNVWGGIFGGVYGIWTFKGSATLPVTTSTVQPAVDGGSSATLSSFQVTVTGYKSPSTGANDAGAGDTAWSNPTNITASDDSRATVALAASGSSQWLKASGFFSAGEVPNGAVIEGVLVEIEYSRTAGTGSPRDIAMQLRLSGTQVGVTKQRKDTSSFTLATDTYLAYGGLNDCWFAQLSGSDLANLEVWYRICNINAAATATVGIDHIRVKVAYQSSAPRRIITSELAAGRTTTTVATGQTAPPTAVFSNDSVYFYNGNNGGTPTGTNITLYDFFRATALPATAYIDGVLMRLNYNYVTGHTDEQFVTTCQLLDAAGTSVGSNQGSSESTGILDTDFIEGEGEISFGAEGYNWGILDLRGSDLWQSGVNLDWSDTGITTADQLGIDFVGARCSYRLPGINAGAGTAGNAGSADWGTTTGSWSPGVDPNNDKRIVVIAPLANDGSAVTEPRVLRVLTFAYDTAYDRISVTTSAPHTDLAYVEDAFYHMGGVRVAGGSTSGAAKEAVQLDLDSGDAFPLGFPQVHGTTAVRIVGGYSLGTAAMYWVCNSASTDAQLWMEYDAGKWLPYGAIFSNTLAGAMSTQPLALAERTPDTQQEQLYCFYPSSTNTAVIRQFVPHDPFIDPQLITGNTFQDGPLYVIMPEIAFAPMENRNAITGLQLQSHQVDDNTAYGSVIIAGDTGGDLTVASAEISETFDAAAEAFTDRAVPSSGGSNSPGVTAQTIVWKLTLNGTASSSKTSNALPFTVYTHSQDQLLPVFEMTVTDAPEAPASFVAHLATLQTTKSVQRLVGGGFDVPAVLEPWDATWAATQGLERVGWGDIRKPLVLRFRQVHGSIAV